MSDRFEWVHASELPEVVSPAELEDLAPDGNDAKEWGVSAGEVMLYGSPQQLQLWLQSALDDLAEPLRKAENARYKATATAGGFAKCRHGAWELFEEGYERTWNVSWSKADRMLTAQYTGVEDFSEAGTGTEMLRCMICGHVKHVPADVEIDWR